MSSNQGSCYVNYNTAPSCVNTNYYSSVTNGIACNSTSQYIHNVSGYSGLPIVRDYSKNGFGFHRINGPTIMFGNVVHRAIG
jgi:hypothetical protein